MELQIVCDPIRVGNFIRSVVRPPVSHVNTPSTQPIRVYGIVANQGLPIPAPTSLHACKAKKAGVEILDASRDSQQLRGGGGGRKGFYYAYNWRTFLSHDFPSLIIGTLRTTTGLLLWWNYVL